MYKSKSFHSLYGKTAIVTGSSRGIGSQIARLLAERGSNVAICYFSEDSREKSELLASELRKDHGVRVVCIQEDLAIAGAGERIFMKAIEGLNTGSVDILINNAALDPTQPLPVQESPSNLFDKFMQINAKAPMELVCAMIPRLPPSGGRIISVSSILARRPDVPFAAWASSKAALECLSRYWAKELGIKYRVTSNVVAIGPTMTDYHNNDPPELLEELAELPTAAKRLGTPDDVAQIVAFLASDAGRWINGDIIQGNGGMQFT